MSDEFKVFGMTVPRIAMAYGAILVFWGLIAYFIQSSDPPSITAMIPAIIGSPMLLLGVLSELNPLNRHHYMHASMVVALLMALGGSRVITGFNDMSILASFSHFLLLLPGVSFVVIGIRSFRHTRLLREGGIES